MGIFFTLIALLSFFVYAEEKTLLKKENRTLYFDDGSIYKLNHNYAKKFEKEAVGSQFEVIQLERREQPHRDYKIRFVSDKGTYYGKQISKAAIWRGEGFKQRFEKTTSYSKKIEKKEAEKNPSSRLIVVSQKERQIALSDGTYFETQALLPPKKLEGEEVFVEEISYYQLKTASGQKTLVKRVSP